jgi:uncharacterized membrane protein (DUF485 family)
MSTSAVAEYRPGECNIGSAEIARRRRGAWAATVLTLGLYVALLTLAWAPVWRLTVALPAAAAAITWLQVRERFCVAFGGAGVFNLGPLGRPTAVVDAAARRADRRKAASMIARGALLGLLPGIAAVLVP